MGDEIFGHGIPNENIQSSGAFLEVYIDGETQVISSDPGSQFCAIPITVTTSIDDYTQALILGDLNKDAVLGLLKHDEISKSMLSDTIRFNFHKAVKNIDAFISSIVNEKFDVKPDFVDAIEDAYIIISANAPSGVSIYALFKEKNRNYFTGWYGTEYYYMNPRFFEETAKTSFSDLEEIYLKRLLHEPVSPLRYQNFGVNMIADVLNSYVNQFYVG